MKRIISVLLSVVLILSLATVSFAADDATITVASVTAEDGVANVTISLSNNPGITSMLLSVTYDSALTLTGVTDAGQLGTPLHSTQADDLKKNPYTLLWNDMLAMDDHRVNGAIVTLKFKVNDGTKPGDYAISVSYDEDDVANSDGDNVPFAVVNGKVTIEGAATACTHTNAVPEPGVAATHTEAGYRDSWHCIDCDKYFSNAGCTAEIGDADDYKAWAEEGPGYIPAIGHSYGDWTPCTDDNTKHYQECGCGNIVKEPHTGGTATCTSKKECSKCGEPYGDVDTVNGHDWETEYTVDTEATCYAKGSESIHCTRCSEIKDARDIDMIAHTPSQWQMDETDHWKVCTVQDCGATVVAKSNHVDDNKDNKCDVCDADMTPAAHEHVYDREVADSRYLASAATCTTRATYYYSCPCGEKDPDTNMTFTYGDVDSTNHVGETEVRNATEATCGAAGYTGDTYCKSCDQKISDGQSIPKSTEHTGSSVMKSDATGHWTECSVCHEIIDARANHVYDNDEDMICNTCEYDRTCTHEETELKDAEEATCTETGYTGDTVCKNCGATVEKGEVIPAKDHTEVVDEAVAPTCTETGLTEGKHCSVCNTVIVAQVTVQAKGHTEVIDEAVAPTCTETGLTEGKHCSVCNAVLVAQQTVQAKGHTEVVDEAVAPTCTTDGKTAGSHCEACGATIRAQEIIKATGHKWSAWVVEEPATYDKEGLKTRYCENCKTPEREVIPKLVRPVTPVTPDTPVTPTNNNTTSPKSGDAGIMLYAGMSVMSLMGMGWVAKKRHD